MPPAPDPLEFHVVVTDIITKTNHYRVHLSSPLIEITMRFDRDTDRVVSARTVIDMFRELVVY